MEKLKYHLLVMLATVLVAGSFIASEKLAGVINPFSLTLLRFLGAALILLPFVIFKKSLRTKITSSFPRAFIVSFFYTMFFIGFFESLKTTTSLNTGTLFTLVPLLTAIVSIFILKEKISIRSTGVYLLGILGTVWVIFKGDIEALLLFSLNQGDIVFIVAILFMSLYSVSMKFLYKNDELIVFVFCTLLGGSVWMLLATFILEKPLEWQLLKGDLVLYMSYLIIGATLATVYLYQITTLAIGPTKVNSYIYLNPAIVVILVLIVNNEPISLVIVPGIMLSVLATIVLQFNKVAVIEK